MFNITQRYQFQFTNVHNLFKKVIRTEDRGLLTYLLENVDFMFSLLHVYCMDNLEKVAREGTQDGEKQQKQEENNVVDTTMRKQTHIT
jgi:hypothetical protein